MMNTLYIESNDLDYLSATKLLKSGGLIAFPTETVYGLGGNALDKNASKKIYAAKGRPCDNPLIIHISKISDVHLLASDVPNKALLLMEAFWPGPLTIVLNKSSIVPNETTGGLGTVALRMPSHPVALNLIKNSNIYIAAPSANLSGRPSPTTASHVLEDLDGKIEMIIDGGPVGIGIESTIVDLTQDVPTILRPGFITKTMIESIIGEVIIDKAITEFNSLLAPKAPGMKYTHYAPKGFLTIIDGKTTNNTNVFSYINNMVLEKEKSGETVAVLCHDNNKHLICCNNIFPIGEQNNGETVAANLYAALRKCDKIDAAYIFSETFDDGDFGYAIMNRLLKAAGQNIITI